MPALALLHLLQEALGGKRKSAVVRASLGRGVLDLRSQGLLDVSDVADKILAVLEGWSFEDPEDTP